MKGIHNIKIGATYEHTFLTEKDAFGMVDPTANAPCLNADGSPDTDPLLTEPGRLHRSATAELGQGSVRHLFRFLACYDLTRTAALPASDGCPNSTSGIINYLRPRRHQGIRLLSPGHHHMSTTGPSTWASASINTTASSAPRRRNLAWASLTTSSPANTVLRVSYARTMETPFNENLVLASLGCNDPVIIAFQTLSGRRLRDDHAVESRHAQ